MPAPLKSPPRTSDETRALYEEEIVKSKVDKDKLRFLSDLLQSQERSEERAEKSAVSLLATITAERDTLAARVAELEPIAARVVELETFKATNDEWRAEQVRALTEEATKKLWAAERFRNEAKNISEEAHSKFDKAGLQSLLDFVQKLIEQFSIPEPDPTALPNGISSLILTCWGYTPTRATLMLGYAKTFPEPSEAYRQTLLRYLKATLPLQQFAGMEPPAPVEHLREKIEVLRSLGQKWPGVLADIEQEFTQLQIQRQAEFLRTHTAEMIAQEHDSALRGEGRTPLGQQAPVSSVPPELHLEGCCCPIHAPGLRRPNSLDVVEESL